MGAGIPPPPVGATIDPPAGIPPPPDGATIDSGSASVQSPTIKNRLKTIGQHTAVMAAGTAPMASGAAMGAGIGGALGGPPGAAVGGILGAGIGGYAIPAFEYAASRLVGLDRPVPTYAEARHAALTSAVTEAAGPVAQKTFIEPVTEALTGTARKGLEEVFGIAPGYRGAAQAGAAAESAGQELQSKQAEAKADIQAGRAQVGLKARQEYAKDTAEARAQVSKATAKLTQNIQRDVESARPAAAEQVAQSQAQKMVGKTPQQFAQEAAQPYEQRATARARAQDPVFDASSKFHEEVGAKFTPYVKNDPISDTTAQNVGGTVTKVESTLEQRGQRIESAELRKIIDDLRQTGVMPEQQRLREALAKSLKGKKALELPGDPDAFERLMTEGVPKEEELTYKQLWGYRARANKVLATSRNPADRWAANELVTDLTKEIPGVPKAIREQYSFERTMNRSVMNKVAAARTPQEVGEAIFGSKASPEPAEVPLSIIRFTKQNAPDQMDGIRQAFADRFLGNRMDANDLGKMNPNVLHELYGNGADDVIRLLGPEGNVKQAAWNDLIRTDPQAQALYQKAMVDSLQKQQNQTLQDTIDAGNKALQDLGTEGEALRRAVAKAKDPEAKVKLLAQGLPDVETAKLKGFKAGVRKGAFQFERYMQRRLTFMGMFAAMGGGGALLHHPDIGLTMGAVLGGRAGMRALLSTDTGATFAMKALNMNPNLANVPAFGQATAAILSATIVKHVDENAGSNLPR